MRDSFAVIAVVTMIALAGCAGFGGGESTAEPSPTETEQPDETTTDSDMELEGNDTVSVENESTNATSVNQTLRVGVNETVVGEEWTGIGATYPRENFTVSAAQHRDIFLGIDNDSDGEVDRVFNETHVSGVNNNEFSFDVTLDTDYTLQANDTVIVQYPAVDNPSEPGEYEIEVRVNDRQTTNSTLTIE